MKQVLNNNCGYCNHTDNDNQNEHVNCSECDQLFNKDELKYVAIHPEYSYQTIMCCKCEHKTKEIMLSNNTISNIVIDWLEQYDRREYQREQDWKEQFGE